jgi:hypothetical protein
MELNHLSDEQIQEYLDNSNPAGRAEIENHLQQCRSCSHRLQIYQNIYRQLRRDMIPDLSANFAGSVLAKIKTSRDKKTNFWENIFIIVLLLAGAMVGSYLLDPIPLLKSVAKPWLDVFSDMPGKVPLQLNSNLVILAGGVIILIFYEFLNNKIVKPKL